VIKKQAGVGECRLNFSSAPYCLYTGSYSTLNTDLPKFETEN